MKDVLALLQLIQALAGQIREASELVQRMREEGRDTLTPEELESLKASDDAARENLTEAIARAQAEGR